MLKKFEIINNHLIIKHMIDIEILLFSMKQFHTIYKLIIFFNQEILAAFQYQLLFLYHIFE